MPNTALQYKRVPTIVRDKLWQQQLNSSIAVGSQKSIIPINAINAPAPSSFPE